MASLSIPNPSLNLSSLRVLKTSSHHIHLPPLRFPPLSITAVGFPPSTTIRMGGGPRTFPGGVSKWQWKRMQAKKAKQLLKARLCRERQIYEMRKRAELQAAVSELERPWEVVEKAPKLFSVKADEQLKVLADRFQRPGGYDLWTEKDGPQLFRSPADGLPSARFFPKDVVHSVRPYGRITESSGRESGVGSVDSVEGVRRVGRRWRRALNSRNGAGSSREGDGRRNSQVRNCNLEGNAEEMKVSRFANSNSRKEDNAMKGRRGLYDSPSRRVVAGRNSKRENGLETNAHRGFHGGRNGNNSLYDPSRNHGSRQGHESEEEYLYGLEPEWASIDIEVSERVGFVEDGVYKGSSRRFGAQNSEGLYGSDSEPILLDTEESKRIPFTSNRQSKSIVYKSNSFYGADSEWGSTDEEDSRSIPFTGNRR